MSFTLLASQLDAIALACQRHHVARMHLFGSAVRDDFQPGRSDLDLLVEFQSLEPTILVDAYFKPGTATCQHPGPTGGLGDGGRPLQSLCLG